ncbi:MAG: pyridoxine 5'-phosphate synthase [Spirochaetes bacterium]|nr:pyridoxine 5'-phosphate synthase [Spirochaetota bacterium]
MIHLGVNIDHIATIRNARGTREPEVTVAAGLAEMGGADSIVAHLREDRRHINDRDVRSLRESITTLFNLEMSTDKEIVEIALKIKPDIATLVPEKREELTTEGGLDLIKNFKKIKPIVEQMEGKGIRTSLFIDPDEKQIDKVKQIGSGMIEIHTGEYANLYPARPYTKKLEKIKKASEMAHGMDIKVAAGHGLNYQNVSLISSIPQIVELNIGHSIIARAAFVGLKQAVFEMKQIMLQSRK